jgi:hypothetical protein
MAGPVLVCAVAASASKTTAATKSVTRPLINPFLFMVGIHCAFDLCGARTRNRSPYIVNTVTGHPSGGPVTLITSEQEFILVGAVAIHQRKMAQSRPHIKNLGNDPVLTANIEKFAVTIPAHINSDFFSLPRT